MPTNSTTFVDTSASVPGTLIRSSWLNDMNLRAYGEVYDVRMYGATGLGIVDDYAAIQSAIDAMSSAGGALYIPRGTYKLSASPTSVNPIYIFGDGYASNLQCTNGANNGITLSSSFSTIRGLRITGSTTQTSGWRIDLSSGIARILIEDVYIDGGYLQGIRVKAAASVMLRDLTLLNAIATTGVGLRFDGPTGGSNSGSDYNIDNVVMDSGLPNSGNQPFAGILITRCGDLKILNSNIIQMGNNLFINPATGASVTSVYGSNSFFDNGKNAAVIYAQGGTVARNRFESCWFSSSTSEGVLLKSDGGGGIDGTTFLGCDIYGNGDDGILINDIGVINTSVLNCDAAGNTSAAVALQPNVSRVNVKGNRFGAGAGFGNNNYGVLIAAGTGSNIVVVDNTLRDNTTAAILDGATGTGKVIVNNPDYDVARATYDPPSLADGAGTTTTVALAGALLGDTATAAFSLDLQGITVTAWVSTAGTVSVRFQNESGGLLDLASGTLVVRISRLS